MISRDSRSFGGPSAELKPGVAFGQVKELENKRVLDDVARDDHLLAPLRESPDLVLVAASGRAFEEERGHLALELTAGPVLASSLDFVEATGCWVLDAHQDEIVGPAEMRREESALDGRGFGQQRCPNLRIAQFGQRSDRKAARNPWER